MKATRLFPQEVRQTMSPLERKVMDGLGNRETSVRQIYGQMKGHVPLTSIAVTFDRLYKMGLVARRVERGRGGLRYIYTRKQSTEDFERSIVESSVNKLLENFGSTAMSYFEKRFGGKEVKKDGR